MLLYFDSRAYLFPPDEGCCYVFSTRSSYCESLAIYGITFQSDFQSWVYHDARLKFTLYVWKANLNFWMKCLNTICLISVDVFLICICMCQIIKCNVVCNSDVSQEISHKSTNLLEVKGEKFINDLKMHPEQKFCWQTSELPKRCHYPVSRDAKRSNKMKWFIHISIKY